MEAVAEPETEKPKKKKPKAPSLAQLALVAEPMANAGDERELCKKCGLDPALAARPYVPGGYTGKLLVVVSSSPRATLGQKRLRQNMGGSGIASPLVAPRLAGPASKPGRYCAYTV